MSNKPTNVKPPIGADKETVDNLTAAAMLTILAASIYGFFIPQRLLAAVTVFWTVVSMALIILVLLWARNDSPYWPYSASLTATLLTFEGALAAIMTVMMLRAFGPTVVLSYVGGTIFFGVVTTGTFFGIYLKRLVALIEPAKRTKWALAPHVTETKTAKVLGAALLAALATSPTLPGVPLQFLPHTIAVLAIVGIAFGFSDLGLHAAAPRWHNTTPVAVTRGLVCWLINVAAIMLFKGLMVSPSWPYRLAGGAVAILIIAATVFQILRVLITAKKAKK